MEMGLEEQSAPDAEEQGNAGSDDLTALGIDQSKQRSVGSRDQAVLVEHHVAAGCVFEEAVEFVESPILEHSERRIGLHLGHRQRW